MSEEVIELSDQSSKWLKTLIDVEFENDKDEIPRDLVTKFSEFPPLERRDLLSVMISRIDPLTVDSLRKYQEFLSLYGDDFLAIQIADFLIDKPIAAEVARPLVEVVRQISTRGAFMEIQRLAFTAMSATIVMEARAALMREADERGVRVWKIEDDLVPDCGLKGEGARFKVAKRMFEFQLGADLGPTLFETETGDRFQDLPFHESTPQSDLDRWHVLKNHVEDVVPVQVKRLEQALALQYRWEASHWKENVLGHPMMKHFVQRALWARYKPTGKFLESFRIDEDGEMCDCNDDAFRLSDDGLVGLLHPINLYPEIAELWGEQFADYEIVTLFPQIDRPLYYVLDGQKKDLAAPINFTVDEAIAHATLFRRGWVEHTNTWQTTISKTYRFHDIFVSLSLTKTKNGKLHIDSASFRRFLGYPQHGFQLRDVPNVVYSEVMYDIELLKTASS